MAVRSIMLLCAACSVSSIAATAQFCAENETGTCEVSAQTPRIGGAMLQTKSQTNYTLAPHGHHGKHHAKHAASSAGDPDAVFLSLANRVQSCDDRVTQLETKSGEGREALRTGLDALKEATTAASGGLDAAKARIASAEGALAALQDVANENHKALRESIDGLKSDFEGLGNRIGQHWSAMLESWSERGDPAGAANLVAQVTKLEERCAKLEEESGAGREELKNELDALQTQIADTQAGGSGSLEHSRSRVLSVEHEVSALAAAVDDQGAELTEALDNLKHQQDKLTKHVGGALSQTTKLKVNSPAEVNDPGAALPLISRISSLEKRAEMLEAKSDGGRGDLQIQLDELNNQLGSLKEGGVESLAHTVVRVTSMEAEVASLTAAVEQQKTDISTRTDELKTMVEGLSSRVGAR